VVPDCVCANILLRLLWYFLFITIKWFRCFVMFIVSFTRFYLFRTQQIGKKVIIIVIRVQRSWSRPTLTCRWHWQQCLNCWGGVGAGIEQPTCFLNPANIIKLCTGGVSYICYRHTIYITILVRLRPSKRSTPANFSHFKHWMLRNC